MLARPKWLFKRRCQWGTLRGTDRGQEQDRLRVCMGADRTSVHSNKQIVKLNAISSQKVWAQAAMDLSISNTHAHKKLLVR